MEDKTIGSKSAKSNKGIWYVLAIVLLILFIFGLASNKKPAPETTYTTTPAALATPTKIPRIRTGSYGIATKTIPVGGTQNLILTMDSGQHTVVGYDVLFRYNPTEVSVGQITSLVPSFTPYAKDSGDGTIAVTVVKDQKVKTPSVFSHTQVLSIPVTVKKAGLHSIDLLQESGRSEAKYFDEQTTAYYPAVSSVTVQSQ